MAKKRILSGMRPTGRLHIGNYLGAAKGMLALQEDPNYEAYYMVVDLHALTTPFDKETLARDTREVIRDYLSVGLSPQKSVIFVQSHVPAHSELAFMMSSTVTVARMMHLPTYKEKVKQYPQDATMALLNYPVLMAADILAYKAHLVPVGIDQESHIEVAREIARKMNSEFGTDFPEPQRFATPGESVPSLSGEGKMSKSVEGTYINLTDGLDEIRNKLAKIPTDSGKGEVVGPGNVDVNIHIGRPDKTGNVFRDATTGEPSKGLPTLFKLIQLFMPNKTQGLIQQYSDAGLRYQDLKEELANAIFEELKPIQGRRGQIEDTYIDEVIQEGARKAGGVAKQTVSEVKQKMGLLP